MASTIKIIRGLPGIVGIKFDPRYCQYGWTAVSVWLDLFSNRQLTVMWIQLETTYTKRVHPQLEYKTRMKVMPPAVHIAAQVVKTIQPGNMLY